VSEKEKLLNAVRKIHPDRASEITELIASLPKKDRALCLFNTEILKAKVAEAKEVLDATEEEVTTSSAAASVVSGGEQSKATTPAEAVKESAVAAAKAKAQEEEPTTTTTTYTLESLAKLPASEIVRIASSSTPPPQPLSRPDSSVAKEIDAFVDGLRGKPAHEQKQKLGERLFKVVKGFGIKNSVSLILCSIGFFFPGRNTDSFSLHNSI
jgi:polyadenylate-binding protein